MSKQEVLDELKRTGDIDRRRKTPVWEKAFNLYNQAFPLAKLRPSCGGCFNRVLSWLRS